MVCGEEVSCPYAEGQGHTDRLMVDSPNSLPLCNFWMAGGISLIFHWFVYLTKKMCREQLSCHYLQGQGHTERFKVMSVNAFPL